MEPLTVTAELQFREEAMKRTLQELRDNADLDGLHQAAQLLSSLWHQQTVIAQWFAKEAQNGLAEAWRRP